MFYICSFYDCDLLNILYLGKFLLLACGYFSANYCSYGKENLVNLPLNGVLLGSLSWKSLGRDIMEKWG